MATEQGVVRLEEGTRSTLLCGYPGCGCIAVRIIELEWLEMHWTGVIGSCDEHDEDFRLLILKARGR